MPCRTTNARPWCCVTTSSCQCPRRPKFSTCPRGRSSRCPLVRLPTSNETCQTQTWRFTMLSDDTFEDELRLEFSMLDIPEPAAGVLQKTVRSYRRWRL